MELNTYTHSHTYITNCTHQSDRQIMMVSKVTGQPCGRKFVHCQTNCLIISIASVHTSFGPFEPFSFNVQMWGMII